VAIGNPLDASTLVGPLIDERAFKAMQARWRRPRKRAAR
jgi:acyl-CoA reductase-like NAD-dependent aldehyde dehydrogenase